MSSNMKVDNVTSMSNSVPSLRKPRVSYANGASVPAPRLRTKSRIRVRSSRAMTLRMDVPINSSGEDTANNRTAAGLHISQMPLI